MGSTSVNLGAGQTYSTTKVKYGEFENIKVLKKVIVKLLVKLK